MRWTMHPTRATTRSQHASRVIAALQLIVTTFVMHAMLGRCPRQLKMPRPDAYGERAAVVMSLLQSAKLNGHEPWAYLKDVLTRLPTQLNSRIGELLPHRWQRAD